MRRTFATALVLSLSACSGGGSASIPATGRANGVPRNLATVRFTIVVPRRGAGHARAPRYVSPATQSASITAAPSGGTPGAPVVVNCTATCTGQIDAPIGNDTFAASLFDAPNATGNLLSTGTVTQTIVIDQANAVNVTFNGVVAGVRVTLAPATVHTGSPSSVAVNVAALDADGNTIVGPGTYVDASGTPFAIALSDSDTSGATQLSQTSVSAPATPITLSYNGASIPNPTVGANGSGISPAHAQLTVATTGAVTEFSTGISAKAGLSWIAAGADGNLWFTERNLDRIGRITPSGTVTEFSAGITAGAGPQDITAGPDGNLWFTEGTGNRIGRITTSGTVTEFSTGISANSMPLGITAGPDGNLWFTENFRTQVGRITPGGVVTEFGNGFSANGTPDKIAAGPDGNLWFTQDDRRIGRMTTSGALTEFCCLAAPGSNPSGITAGPDGNLWFAEDYAGSAIGRITPAGVITQFFAGLSYGAYPFAIVAAPDGNLWFTESGGNRVGRITTTGSITEFSNGIATNAGPTGMTVGPDGNLWFTEYGANQIGRITP